RGLSGRLTRPLPHTGGTQPWPAAAQPELHAHGSGAHAVPGDGVASGPAAVTARDPVTGQALQPSHAPPAASAAHQSRPFAIGTSGVSSGRRLASRPSTTTATTHTTASTTIPHSGATS